MHVDLNKQLNVNYTLLKGLRISVILPFAHLYNFIPFTCIISQKLC